MWSDSDLVISRTVFKHNAFSTEITEKKFQYRSYKQIRHVVHLSVRLSVTFVHCGHSVQWIPDIFACLDRWISLLLTDNASPGSSDGMMPGFLVEEGVWKNW